MPATPLDAITAASTMIDKLADLLAKWMSGADIRRMKKAIECGERYIRTAGPLIAKHFPRDEAKVIKELEDLEAAFFKYN